MKIKMSLAGRAWRGYFPVGGELTSGYPDMKEGVYFGEEIPSHHATVKAGLPFHGENLFPHAVPEIKPLVLDYMAEMQRLGHTLMEGLSLSLGLPINYFYENYTKNPLMLFRIFNYPPSSTSQWGVGEHTDYGVLTILKQDDCGGLEVKSKNGWI
jgi:isopenicillin N synthase-like dioxygenase